MIFLPGRVAKLYDCPRKNLMAHDQQELAARHGLGPDVFGMFETVINSKHYYGYLSERVRVIKPEIDDKRKLILRNAYGKYEKEIQSLGNKLMNIGISEATVYDLHQYNVGWKGDTMVCIDFGRADEDTPSWG